MIHVAWLVFVILLAMPRIVSAGIDDWSEAKDLADDFVHREPFTTFYCGCPYVSDGDRDGSGKVDLAACGYIGPTTHQARAERVEWEHIVPASLMPARQFECWAGEGGSRDNCERNDPRAQAMIFDLHNLVPSIGQVNALRGNDRYRDLPNDTSWFGSCTIEDNREAFDPPDCKKGDVARVWLYMADRYGIELEDGEKEMFEAWALSDPVSPWEFAWHWRAAFVTGVVFPAVVDATPAPSGSCSWESTSK